MDESRRSNMAAVRETTMTLSKHFIKACKSYTIYLLLASASLSLALETMEEGAKDGWHESVAILATAFLLVGVSSVLNFYRARKWEAKILLRGRQVCVRRGAVDQFLSIWDILEGDIIVLKTGDPVPADGLLISGEGLVLDGESNVGISHDSNPFLSSGSIVMEGQGRMLAVLLAPKEDAEVSQAFGSDPDEKDVFLRRIQKPEEYMDKVKLLLSVLIIFVLLVRLICGKDDYETEFPELKTKASIETLLTKISKVILQPRGRLMILTSAFTVVIMSLQHGIPLLFTISLSFWTRKLSSDIGAFLKSPSACGTMGISTVVCVDVSCSRVIQNPAQVTTFFIGVKEIEHHEEALPKFHSDVQLGLESTAFVCGVSRGPTDATVMEWLKSKLANIEEKFHVIESKSMSCNGEECLGILLQVKEENDSTDRMMHYWLWKGAGSAILGLCSCYSDSEGNNYAIDNQRDSFKRIMEDMESDGLMPIAFAYRRSASRETEENGLILLAILGLRFCCKEDVKSAIRDLRKANIDVKLVTEDDLPVAKTIAYKLDPYGLDKNDAAIKGVDFLNLSDNDKDEKVDQISIMVRASPEAKLCFTKTLKQRKGVLAFVGGGVTTGDGLALIEADVGISTSSDHQMVQDMSSIVLCSDEGFAPIPKIIQQGRFIYQSFQMLIQFELTAGICALFITSIPAMVTGDSPITAFQLIWVNLVVVILSLPLLITEVPSEERMIMITAVVQSSVRDASALTKDMWVEMILQVMYQAVALLTLQFLGKDNMTIKPMVFNSFVLCQIFDMVGSMTLKKPVLQQLNTVFCVTVAAVLAIQVFLVQFGTSLAFYVKLNRVQWGICLALSVPCLLFNTSKELINSARTRTSSTAQGAPLRGLSPTRLTWVCVLGFPPLFCLTRTSLSVSSNWLLSYS